MRAPGLMGLAMAFGLTACVLPPPSPAVVVPAEPAWTHFTADQGWVVRAVAAVGAQCPSLRRTGGSAVMAPRSAPGEVASRVAGGAPA